MQPRLLATMVTTTTYGSWLPGDVRGYVDRGEILPSDPARLQIARQRMGDLKPVCFSPIQQATIFKSLCDACIEFEYQLSDASVESWHLHWIVHHGYDSVAVMVGRLKNRMRQALNLGRIWTEGYYNSLIFDEAALSARRQYVARHAGCHMTEGRVLVFR